MNDASYYAMIATIGDWALTIGGIALLVAIVGFVIRASQKSKKNEKAPPATQRRFHTAKTNRVNYGRWLLAAGALALVIGAFLPWVEFTFPGWELADAGGVGYKGDGIFTGAIGLVLLILVAVLKGNSGKPYSIPGVLLGIVAAIIVVPKIIGISPINDIVLDDNFSIGVGLVISVIGAVSTIVGGGLPVPRLDEKIQRESDKTI